MADVTKVLIDDHARLRRLFKAFSWGTYAQAMNICDELIIQATIKEELIYPAVRDEIDPSLATKAEDGQERIKEEMAAICDLDSDDPSLDRMTKRLGETVLRQIEMEETMILPKINTVFHDQLLEMGNQVFALRQELLAVKPTRVGRKAPETANTGWGKQLLGRTKGGTANVGW